MMKFIVILFLPIWVYCQGTFKVSNGIYIVSTNDPVINLYNTNLNNETGDNDFNDGTVWSLSGTSTITGTSIIKFSGLRLNNPTGFTLSGNTTISNRLDMSNGNINLNSYTLEVGTSPTNPGQINWTSGTINGPLKRWFAASTNLTQASGIFPIGKDGINRNVTINYTQSPTEGGYIIVEYKTGIPSMIDNYSGLPLWTPDGQLIQNYEDEGYFDITPSDYNNSLNSKQYTLTIRANQLADMNDRSIVRLIKSPGPNHDTWVACGSHSSINGSSNSDFTITSTNITGFSWFNFGSQNNNPLPVELLYFEGTEYPSFNSLKWATASEQNSSHFIVEKSHDGEDWRQITIKPAAGNSNSTLKYYYLDNINYFGLTYYKLVQYDINGEYKEYGPIVLDNTIKVKKVVKYVNLMGQEVNAETKGVVFEVYEDGTSKKIIR